MLPEARLELAEALDDAVEDGLLDDGLPAGGVPACALSLPGLLEVLELLLDPPLNFAFFSTKVPPPALLELAPLDGLPLGSLLDDPPPRCRQPVAVIEPAVAPVDGCGVEDVGLWAASVPHSATAVLSVMAHCHPCVFFMSLSSWSACAWRARPGRSPCERFPRGRPLQGTIHDTSTVIDRVAAWVRSGPGIATPCVVRVSS